MADYSITAANVLSSGVNNGAVIRNGIAGALLTAGLVLYKDTGDANKLKPADANAAAPINVVEGIALHGAAAGQPIQYVTQDPSFTPGFTVAAGDTVILSATNGPPAGQIAPDADAVTGWFKTILGVGIGSNKIKLGPFIAAGVAK